MNVRLDGTIGRFQPPLFPDFVFVTLSPMQVAILKVLCYGTEFTISVFVFRGVKKILKMYQVENSFLLSSFGLGLQNIHFLLNQS